MKDRLKDGRMQIFWAQNIVFDEYGKKIGSTALLVYLCLTRHANAKSTCFPSINRIALECGIKSKKTVIGALKTLVDFKLISVQKRSLKSGGQTSNLYKLLPLENTPIDEIDEPVQKLHPPSVKITPPPV